MDWSLTLSTMAWSLLGIAAINVGFDYLFDALEHGKMPRRGYVWLPRDVTVEDLEDVSEAQWEAWEASWINDDVAVFGGLG